ncbi:class I SAM-dependent methyltransferase [Psychromarinibacter sp. C21-152]|uniref:Class I SAM-dependent methyltransferase n=1 Tax=Psychromarinibacter sediminicola TaxID=3033385 RepID=A0AAE3NWA0_9RHOB|nr:class I SAM-dependent methyltransferase [Psychromarinibacter sediminicola]MDF0602849.1 class I SAM-dependent methyltransferase [Psychromarinibacter sediminicola]
MATDWDARYDREDYLFGTEPAKFVVAHGGRVPQGAHVLAVADGEGRNSVWLAKRGVRVTSMDSSEKGLAKARRLAEEAGVSVAFRIGDVAHWDWEGESYDAILAVFIQFAPPALRDEIHRGFDKALKPGGLLLMHGFAPRQVNLRHRRAAGRREHVHAGPAAPRFPGLRGAARGRLRCRAGLGRGA